MDTVNYARELERIMSSLTDRPTLLLHCCCAPCSSYCLTYLVPYFDITCFYYNPNITAGDEYEKRYRELVRLVGLLNDEYAGRDGITPIEVRDGMYDPDTFNANVSREDLAGCPEGGRRCKMCFSMRLSKTYETAAKGGFDYFTTTLTISPLKDAKLINSIGQALYGDEGPVWLPSDFKKNDGFKKSVELSRKYDLYRQNYCGCDYSRRSL